MRGAYKKCRDEKGTGSYMRREDDMHEYILSVRGTMFVAATKKARGTLQEMFDSLEQMAEKKTENIIATVKANSSALITNQGMLKSFGIGSGPSQRCLAEG
ncbi:hypothetical protein B0T16DRAFT_458199 [Cercophora newfieldiana]|uniref:Uncharacterized protein n=1 Tax=Cercophora newfieldiana TaxID=92897 RepID=A0AA39Y579_9PEZI|nr:hypothetical protein B0T16DRAFT_458199 [Cercophora newfieldiana]